MKIEMLSFADPDLGLGENTVISDATTEDEISAMQAEAAAAGEEAAVRQQEMADEETAVNLINQTIDLEQLFDRLAQSQKLTSALALEAHEANPHRYIIETWKSGASEKAKYDLAMEGIAEKMWEAVKRLWAHLAAMGRKFMQYINRFIEGDWRDLKVDQALVSKLEGMLHETTQRLQSNQQHGIILRDSPDENKVLLRAWSWLSNGEVINGLAAAKKVLPQSAKFNQLTKNYLATLERWAADSLHNPTHQTVLPASPESTMHEFLEGVDKIKKSMKSFKKHRDDDMVKRLSVTTILSAFKNVVIEAEYGQELALVSTMRELIDAIEKRQRDIEKITSKEGIDANKSRVYRRLGEELTSLLGTVREGFHFIRDIQEAQSKVLGMGYHWIQAVSESYSNMNDSSTKNYSEDEKKKFKAEHEFFSSMADKYKKALGGKNMTTNWV